MTDIVILLAIGAIATVGGVWFGIVVVAPRMSHILNRPETTEEEPGDRPD
ncbi:MAG TPA: hypothetical protein VE011_11405 [Candidatus Dormibacteraeota bacterium]|nr:hypothetical protein [Candidatus Dormibacteraeota bacterium]